MTVVTHVEGLINRRTKIIATVGPASEEEATLVALMEAGVNVFRLNMSHGDQDGHRQVYQRIRRLSAELSLPVAILADLCGPKIRTGRFPGGSITLTAGSEIAVSTVASLGAENLIVSQYEALARDVAPGDAILLADGLFELKVLSSDGEVIRCKVVQGGVLGDNKGINLPGVAVSAPSLTEKDRDDAAFAAALGVDFLALSFVREAADIDGLKAHLDTLPDPAPQIVAKIEKPEALVNAGAILNVTDAIMVARGDLGVELPPEQVPVAQTRLIDLARKAGKPVIVATQMLESMVGHSRPTRAEVTDVSHAVTSGADAVMLSAETAVGEFPVETVEMMNRIAREAEAHLWASDAWGERLGPQSSVAALVATAASQLSRDLDARALLVVTQSGASAQTISSARPAAPVLAVTASARIYNQMSLCWGVVPILDPQAGTANPNDLVRELAAALKLAVAGQHVLLVRGFHDDRQMNQPTVTVITL